MTAQTSPCSGLPACEEALVTLARELGRGQQIHRDKLKELFGPRYVDVLQSLEDHGFINQQIDGYNQRVHIIQFKKPALDVLAERRERIKRETKAREAKERVQDKKNVIALMKALNVTHADKSYTLTEEKLAGILREPAAEHIERLKEANYLIYDHELGQYEITFLAKSLELLPAEDGKKRKTRADPRSAKVQLLRNGDIRGLAIDARCWLKNLADPQPSKRNASERMLQDLLGYRFDELHAKYPGLLLQIQGALEGPVCESETHAPA